MVLWGGFWLVDGNMRWNLIGWWRWVVESDWLMVMWGGIRLVDCDVRWKLISWWWCEVESDWWMVMWVAIWLMDGNVWRNLIGGWWCKVESEWLMEMWGGIWLVYGIVRSFLLTVKEYIILKVFHLLTHSPSWRGAEDDRFGQNLLTTQKSRK